MAYYITILTQALVAAALTAAFWPTAAAEVPRRWAATASALAAGWVLGSTAALAAVQAPTSATALGAWIDAGAVAAALLALAILALRPLFRRPAPGFGLALAALLATQGVFAAWRLSADHSLTTTEVINTELIVNVAAIATGYALLAGLVAISGPVARLAGHRATAAALVVVLALVLVEGAEKLVLGLLRLDAIAVTPGRVSFVARLSVVTPWFAYAQLGVALGLASVALARRFRMPPGVADRVERRRLTARILGEGRWRRGLVGTAVFLVAVMLYQDLYASRPPSLSPAAPVAPDAGGVVRIPVAEVQDGDLHRFAYIASDGHKVRFFLVNRYDTAQVNIGVVFDSCMICGDDGYVQNGDEIICIACNVRMFRPSIGKPGGCNPIPLDHAVEGAEIVIAAAALEAGARYFSEVVEIAVTDPVTGTRLLNTEAPRQFEYQGRTWFFEGDATYERFRDDPERYVGRPAEG